MADRFATGGPIGNSGGPIAPLPRGSASYIIPASKAQELGLGRAACSKHSTHVLTPKGTHP